MLCCGYRIAGAEGENDWGTRLPFSDSYLIVIYIRIGCIRQSKDSPTGIRNETGGTCLHFCYAKIMVLPPSSWRQTTCHRQVVFDFRVPNLRRKRKTTLWVVFLFLGGDWGTRTLDLMRVKHAL